MMGGQTGACALPVISWRPGHSFISRAQAVAALSLQHSHATRMLRLSLAAAAAALVCAAAAATTVAAAAAASGGPSFPFCGLVMNDTLKRFAFSTVDNATGEVTRLLELPMLDEFGLGVSAGAARQTGLYYTISGSYKEQEEVLVVDLPNAKAGYVDLKLPASFSFLTLYGVAMLDVDETRGTLLAMVMGYDAGGERYCFLGDLDARSGEVTRVAYNLTDAYREWTYLFVFNTSDDSAGADPLAALPAPREGMFLALAISPALGLVALVDDDANTAAALWRLHVPDGDWAKAAWHSVYQYAQDKLTGDGNNNFLLSDDGLTAYSVFYDDHRPIANQVVSAVDLRAGREVGRTVVVGSQDGTASIADLAVCPPALRD